MSQVKNYVRLIQLAASLDVRQLENHCEKIKKL